MINPSELGQMDDMILGLQVAAYNGVLNILTTVRDGSGDDHRKFYGGLMAAMEHAEGDMTQVQLMTSIMHLYLRIRFGGPEMMPSEKIITTMVNTVAGFVKTLELEQQKRERQKSQAAEEDRAREHRGRASRSLH